MHKSSHRFADTYRGPLAFGLSREIDEATLMVYLQKFSDDRLMGVLRGRLEDGEIQTLVELVMNLIRKHLSHDEYHRLFLGEPEDVLPSK